MLALDLGLNADLRSTRAVTHDASPKEARVTASRKEGGAWLLACTLLKLAPDAPRRCRAERGHHLSTFFPSGKRFIEC